MPRKIRVLVGKPGLDGHDRGAKVVAAALRDAGMEVIYTGLHQSPAQIVEAAVQEDVDVVALSVLSGAHMTLFPEVFGIMKERGIGDRLLTGGGIIPPDDMESLASSGIGRLFGPGSSTQDIAAYIRVWFKQHTGEEPFAAPPAPTVAPRMPSLSDAEHAALHPRPARPAAKRAAAKQTARKKSAAKKRVVAKKKAAAKPKSAKRKPAKRSTPKRKPVKRSAPKRKPAKRPAKPKRAARPKRPARKAKRR